MRLVAAQAMGLGGRQLKQMRPAESPGPVAAALSEKFFPD